MSKEVFVRQDIKPNNDLNLHKLLAFASLPVAPGLNIEQQDPVGRTCTPLTSQHFAPPVSQPSASASAAATPSTHPNANTIIASRCDGDTSALPSSVTTCCQIPVGNNTKPQMIASKDVYKMTQAPVFMSPSPSMYPQVALIPETDLLRSMIVQDVKQVTQKLFDKHSKKKRGRRREKEEIIPGDFGTLKINFTKFVDMKHPPFSLEDPPAPKRTVYQRIAPYPTTESNKAPEKPSKKSKGTSTRSFKRLENGQAESSKEGMNESSTCPRLKRNSSGTRRGKQREVRRSLEVPVSTMSQINGLRSDSITNLASEMAFMKTFQADGIPLSASSSSHSQIADLNSSPSTVNCIDTFSNDLGMNARPGFDNGNANKGNELTLVKETSVLDSNSNCMPTSPGFYFTSNDSSIASLLDPSTGMDSSAPNLGSPGVIGNELSSLLSDLYNDFPPLSPVAAEEKMDVAVANEAANTTTVSVLSKPLTSHQSETGVAARIVVTAKENGNVPKDPLGGSASLISPSFELGNCIDQTFAVTSTSCSAKIAPNVVSCTTEVLSDSSWGIQNQQIPFFRTPAQTSSVDKIPVESQNEGLFTMEVDASQSEKPNDLLDIVDISPEYAATEGGGKIILIGSWNNKSARYSCKFGNVCTPGDLIQNGVLRCFCPPHSPGKVNVCVLCDGVIITNSVEFEYVDTEDLGDDVQEECHDWLKIKDEDLKSLLVERIEAMIDIFDIGNTLPRFQGIVCNSTDIEDTLVSICESISKMQEHLPISIDYKSENAMTVLHLSAALGFTKLIQILCSWVDTNANKIIQQEADPCKYDQFHLTPLMWACAKGKFDSVCVLIQWDESSLSLADGCGCTPLSLSRDQGHTILVRYLEKSQSKGNFSKNSSFASDNGSPNLQAEHLSRSSSLSSQVECGRDLHAGNDDVMLSEAARKSPGSNKVSLDGSPDSTHGYLLLSRTLGQTLVHVQAIIQDGVDAHNDNARTPLTSLDLDDDSLFAPSPFTPRMHSNSIDDRHGNHTPKSLASLSPASSAHSPGCQSPFDPNLKDTAEFCEFFYNSDRILEKDFAELTLTDEEQQNLYKAASVIQNAYKRYRERRKQRDVELSAAVLIQSYYRRYKEYAMYKRMQRGAVVIQHKYRAHREKKEQKSQAASVIQSYYRRYKERKNQPMIAIEQRTTPAQQPQCGIGASQQLSRSNVLPEWKKKKFLSQQRSLEYSTENSNENSNSSQHR